MTPPTTRALARRVAVELLDRVTVGAEQLAENLRPALRAAATPSEVVVEPPHPPPAPTPKIAVEDLGWTLARHLSDAFDAQTRALFADGLSKGSHDAETIRRTRIASRRLRSAVELFGPWLGTKLRRRTLKRLKTYTRALGSVRDADVVHAQFEEVFASDDPLRRAAAELIAARLTERRAKVRRRATARLDPVDVGALADDLAEIKRRIVERLTAEPDVRPALARLLEAVCAAAFEKTPVPTTLEDREAVHEVRILAKRLRYAYVWVRPVMQHERGPARLLKRAQRAVGDARDLDLLEQRLERHEAEFREEGQAVLADALTRWREDVQRRRATVDARILPALAEISLRSVTAKTRAGMGLDPDAGAQR